MRDAVAALLVGMHADSTVPASTRARIHAALVARGIVKPAAAELPNLLPPGAKRKVQAEEKNAPVMASKEGEVREVGY